MKRMIFAVIYTIKEIMIKPEKNFRLNFIANSLIAYITGKIILFI